MLYLNRSNKQIDGFSSILCNKTNSTAVPTETGQISCGRHAGLNVGINNAHTIRLSADRQVSGAVNSPDKLGTGTHDVEINAPLKVEGARQRVAMV